MRWPRSLARSNHEMICALTIVLERRFGMRERELGFLACSLAVEADGDYETMETLASEGFIEREMQRHKEMVESGE